MADISGFGQVLSDLTRKLREQQIRAAIARQKLEPVRDLKESPEELLKGLLKKKKKSTEALIPPISTPALRIEPERPQLFLGKSEGERRPEPAPAPAQPPEVKSLDERLEGLKRSLDRIVSKKKEAEEIIEPDMFGISPEGWYNIAKAWDTSEETAQTVRNLIAKEGGSAEPKAKAAILEDLSRQEAAVKDEMDRLVAQRIKLSGAKVEKPEAPKKVEKPEAPKIESAKQSDVEREIEAYKTHLENSPLKGFSSQEIAQTVRNIVQILPPVQAFTKFTDAVRALAEDPESVEIAKEFGALRKDLKNRVDRLLAEEKSAGSPLNMALLFLLGAALGAPQAINVWLARQNALRTERMGLERAMTDLEAARIRELEARRREKRQEKMLEAKLRSQKELEDFRQQNRIELARERNRLAENLALLRGTIAKELQQERLDMGALEKLLSSSLSMHNAIRAYAGQLAGATQVPHSNVELEAQRREAEDMTRALMEDIQKLRNALAKARMEQK